MVVVLIRDGEFVDEHGRVLNLRGVNLGGSSKIPTTTSPRDDGDTTTTTTFVNRPFPIDEADDHFSRLRACGFTLIRFVITWEAIEHSGPGVYDVEYLEYVRSILEGARRYGMMVYIDPHQDVWSRHTGGDGAPPWTLDVVGFDVDNFPICHASLCRSTYGVGQSTSERYGMAYPKMIWPTNYFKLACATMFTLFWAGERYAPHFTVDDDIAIADADGRGDSFNPHRNRRRRRPRRPGSN